MLDVRLLPTLTASGSEQMARDESMLASAAADGVASLRFYRWSEPTLSLGYFQSAESRTALPPLAWVRRASGGAAILHHSPHELTYSISLPPDAAKLPTGESWICNVHHVLRDCLREVGVKAHAVICGEEQKLGEVLCFLHHTPGDLLVAASKVVGSAQRKLRGAILQHGTILLTRSEYTPQLPGIAELSGRAVHADDLMRDVVAGLQLAFEWRIREGDWTAAEVRAAKEIEAEKYRSSEWNTRR